VLEKFGPCVGPPVWPLRYEELVELSWQVEAGKLFSVLTLTFSAICLPSHQFFLFLSCYVSLVSFATRVVSAELMEDF
jgi:hypothetical protein